MGPPELLLHVLNFVAPALFVAVVLALASGWVVRRAQGAVWWVRFGVNFGVGVAVLLAGLWFFRVDGKMATYAALVVCCASSQWLLSRGWRK